VKNKFVRPTPEGQRERIKENIREIAAWLDDRCEEDVGFYDAADVLSRNFVRTHSDDFDIVHWRRSHRRKGGSN